jgi:hypothetical protein
VISSLTIGENESSSSALSSTILSSINDTPFYGITKGMKTGEHDAKVSTALFGWRLEQTIDIFEETEWSLFGFEDFINLPPEDALLALEALRRGQSMSDRVVLAWKTANDESMVRNVLLIY